MTKSARTSIKNPERKPRPEPASSPPPESPAVADESAEKSANPPDSFVPYPLFPPFVLLADHQGLELPINNDVRARLETLDPALEAFRTWRLGIDFLTKHSLRRGFATWASANGWDIKALMTYVGWKDMKSALRYIDPSASFAGLAVGGREMGYQIQR